MSKQIFIQSILENREKYYCVCMRACVSACVHAHVLASVLNIHLIMCVQRILNKKVAKLPIGRTSPFFIYSTIWSPIFVMECNFKSGGYSHL